MLSFVHASSPRFFKAETQADFLTGDVEDLSVDVNGRLVLGPATELIYEASAPFLWSMLAGPDGTLFLGSGNEGKVFRIDANGRGSVFFDSVELEVHALAAAPGGGVYVATSPDGKIYKVDRTGTATTFFDPGEKYIWALAVDTKGTLYAGTGDKGVVYRIAPDGQGAAFYRASATHVAALAIDTSGDLMVGTSSPGRVLRVESNGKPFVILDSPFQEVHTLRFDDHGVLYAAALSGRPSPGAVAPSDDRSVDRPGAAESERAPVPSVSVEITSVTIADDSSTSSPASPAREDRRAATGAVYRIPPDGIWDLVWESRDDAPYDVTVDQNGTIVVATGNKGKMYRLDGDPLQPTLLARASAQQVTAFSRDDRGRLYYTTANPGKLFRLSSQRTDRGTYQSEPQDARTVATWGALSWRGTAPEGARIELSTRSGNTDTPDDTWSGWSAAYPNSEGSPITSPRARYLQWRAVLTGRRETPVLTSVTAAYLQRNLRPRVRSVTVHPPGIVFQKPFSTGDPELAGFGDQSTPERTLAAAAGQSGPGATLGRRTYQKGLQTLAWRADDENDDELVFDILYRRQGETTWTTLRQAVSETILVWDTATTQNGTYFLKIVATDRSSNPPGTALRGELESASFDIDNTPPRIAVGDVRVERGRTVVAFGVKDDQSPLQRVEFSEDGRQWRGVFPVDGIADSRDERYELTMDGALPDRGLTLRATDSMNNVETAHVDRPARR